MATSKKTKTKAAKKKTTAAAKKTSASKKKAAKKETVTAKKKTAKKPTKKTSSGKAKKAPVNKKAASKKAASKKAASKKTATKKTVSAKSTPTKPKKSAPVPSVEPAQDGIGEKKKSRKTPASMRSGLRKIKKALLEKRNLLFEQLQAELKEMERPEKRHRADLEEIASDTHDSDSLCQIMDINASQLDQIDAALKKIDESTYGICEDCDQEISMPRLEALPFATQCIECKRKAELSQVRPAEYYSSGFE